MIRQYELIDKILAYNKDADIALLNRAYVFSMKAHGNQTRASGEPYLIHPLEVASLLADLKLDDASIVVGLLHDTIEDTLASYDEIKALFGVEIADITDGVTKLSQIEFNSKVAEQAENYRKLFLAMSKDIRVLLIKLCDRLHNLRTLHHIPKPEKRRRIAQETMDIYVPLADRIGLHKIKTELEDIAFKELNIDAYNSIMERKQALIGEDSIVEKVVENIKEELAEEGIKATVKGRDKAIYSIFKKMSAKNLTFDQLTDIIAYRIIVDDKSNCYNVLGHIHNIYKAIPGRLKDYISSPKPNGYQSLHTSVLGPFGNRMEVQIRDQNMEEIADMGVAAHWLYKQSNSNKNTEGTQYQWMRHLLETLQDTEDPEELVENAKLDLFADEVFIFSPQGDLITLPKGATPLDFAYSIHSDIGNKCQTAKVNGRVVSLRSSLKTGDQVEIITAKNQIPSRGWIEFVVSGKARSAINRFFRSHEKEEQLRLGREILEKATRREGLSFNDKDLSKVVKEYKLSDIDDIYLGIAQGRVFPRQVFYVLFPERDETPEVDEKDVSKKPFVERRETRVAIDGLTPGMAIYIAKCCNPLPGEKIVGIVNTGRGISIHRCDCTNLEAFNDEPDRWLSVHWNGDNNYEGKDSRKENVFIARLKVSLFNTPGALSDFSTEVFNGGGNITDFSSEKKSKDFNISRCDVEVKNIEHLEKLLASLRKLKKVAKVERLVS